MNAGPESAWAFPPHAYHQPQHGFHFGQNTVHHGPSRLHGRMCASPEPCGHPSDSSDESSLHRLGKDFTPAGTPDRRSSPGQSPEKVTTFGRLSLDDTNTRPQLRHVAAGAEDVGHARNLSGSQKRPANGEPNIGGVALPNAKAVRCNPAMRSRAKPSLQHRRTNSSPLARHQALKSLPNNTTATCFGHTPAAAEAVRRAKLREDSGYYTATQSRSSTLQRPEPQLKPPPPQHTEPYIVPFPSRDLSSDKPWHFPPFTETKPQQTPFQDTSVKQYFSPNVLARIITAPVSEDQLTAEVRGIYTDLVAVENKCIEIDSTQAREIARARNGHHPPPLPSLEDWKAWTALHKTLLYEHHDFLLASQHPSASHALKHLATKYSMPARLWKHGIHAYLEILRHRRPESNDYMPGFIDAAYQLIALLYETVPSFRDTWIECMGDLARYRMAVEVDKDVHAYWAGVASRWYALAAFRRPAIGRLNHHLGILERPSVKKFFYYAKSLTCVTPFPNARDSLTTVCTPIIQDKSLVENSRKSAEACLVTYHALLFVSPEAGMIQYFESTSIRMLSSLPVQRLRDIGASLAVVNISSILELGSADNLLWRLYSAAASPAPKPAVCGLQLRTGTLDPSAKPTLPQKAIRYAQACMMTVCQSFTMTETTTRDALPFVHTMLVFIQSLIRLRAANRDTVCDAVVSPLLRSFGSIWNALSDYLNHLTSHVQWVSAQAVSCASRQKFQQEYTKSQVKEDVERQNKIRAERWEHRREIILQPLQPAPERTYKPLLEDYMLQGLNWTQGYFPDDWFVGMEDDDSRVFETEKSRDMRVERVQGLAVYIALHSDCLDFDQRTHRFSAAVPTEVRRPLSMPEFSARMTPLEHANCHSPTSTATYSANSEETDDGFTMISSRMSTPAARPPPFILPVKQQENHAISIADGYGDGTWDKLLAE